jgi:hypothetical protein
VTARVLLFGGAVLSAVCALVAGGILAVDLYSDRVPSGNRTSMYDVRADDAVTSGRFWFDQQTAEGLSAELAAAVEGTDLCLGWAVLTSTGPTHYDIQGDIGSSRAPGVSARSCERWVELEVTYAYTTYSSPLYDNASLRVDANDARARRAIAEHPAYDIGVDELLREDAGLNEDDLIANAIAGMPLALADAGILEPLAVQPVSGEAAATPSASTTTAPAGGSSSSISTPTSTSTPTTAPTGEPSEVAADGTLTFADQEGEGGHDVWHAHRRRLLFGLAAIMLGVACLLYGWGGFPWGFAALGAHLRAPRRPVNPRRALEAALARANAPEETRAPGPSHR